MLLECLQSIVAQELEDWEAIVVDDGTPTTEVREGVEKLLDDRIRYVRHARNLGPGAARNTGFRAARADVVLPIDSDDTLDPSFLRVTVAALQGDPAADIVFTDFQLFGDSDHVQHQCVRSLRDMPAGGLDPGCRDPPTQESLGTRRRVLGTPEDDCGRRLGLLDRR